MEEKVRVTEEGLRTNFTQWIAKAIEKKKEKSIKSGNLVVIIDGVDKYLGVGGREESPDWLLTELPPSIRIIYTCSKGSRAYDHILEKCDSVLYLNPFNLQSRLYIYNIIHKDHAVIYANEQLEAYTKSSDACGNPLFLKLLLNFGFANVLDTRKLVYLSIEKILTVESLLDYIFDFYCGTDFREEIFVKFLQLLNLTRSGISEEELCRLLTCPQETVLRLLELFSPLLHNSDGFFILKHDLFRKFIERKYPTDTEPLYSQLVSLLDDQKLTIRKVDELLFSLSETKNWMRLKDLLIKLDVFTIMHSAPYKLELYMYWVKLEQQHFDPVQEYNKSLEEFVAQKSPTSKDLFILIVQFCRFFKDLAEVESSFTCKYRHPHFRGYHELKDINFFEEIECLTGMFKNSMQNIKDEEDFMMNETQTTLEQVREKIIDKSQALELKAPEFYYYKRWLWVQMPWCALDVNSDFSKSMQNFRYLSDSVSPGEELNIFLSVIKLVGSLENKERIESAEVVVESPLKIIEPRGYSRGLSSFPGIRSQASMLPQLEGDSRLLPRRILSNSMHISPIDFREYNTEIVFKDLVPGNILQKIGSQVINYTTHELLNQKKEAYELQRTYNRIKEEFRLKSLKLEALRSQIAKSLDKIKEQEEIRNKAAAIDEKNDKINEKYNRAEEEGKRLQKILTCCIKNPTRNDQWERGLEKTLESIKNLIRAELEDIKMYEKETQIFEEQSKAFESVKSQKSQVQNSTLLRVADHLHTKTKIKNKMATRKKRRFNIIKEYLMPKITKKDKIVVEKNEMTMQQLKTVKKLVMVKLEAFNEMVKKLSVFRAFEDVYSLYDIIVTFNRHVQLKEDILNRRKEIEYITREKEALELQLRYFKKKKFRDLEKPAKFSSFDEVTYHLYVAEKRLEESSAKVKAQEYVLMKGRILAEHCWKKLKVEGKLENRKEELVRNLRRIGRVLTGFGNDNEKEDRAASALSDNFTIKSTVA